MNIREKLLKLIYEAYELSKQPSKEQKEENPFKNIRKDIENKNTEPKKPQNSIYFEKVVIQIINPTLSLPLVKFLNANKVKFENSKDGKYFELQDVPADPIIVQLALNIPENWMKMKGREKDQNDIKNIKVKGNESRANVFFSKIENDR